MVSEQQDGMGKTWSAIRQCSALEDLVDGVCSVSLGEERPLLYRHIIGCEHAATKDKNKEPRGKLNRQQPKSNNRRIHCPLVQNVLASVQPFIYQSYVAKR
jgi:hypothetical protein